MDISGLHLVDQQSGETLLSEKKGFFVDIFDDVDITMMMMMMVTVALKWIWNLVIMTMMTVCIF